MDHRTLLPAIACVLAAALTLPAITANAQSGAPRAPVVTQKKAQPVRGATSPVACDVDIRKGAKIPSKLASLGLDAGGLKVISLKLAPSKGMHVPERRRDAAAIDMPRLRERKGQAIPTPERLRPKGKSLVFQANAGDEAKPVRRFMVDGEGRLYVELAGGAKSAAPEGVYELSNGASLEVDGAARIRVLSPRDAASGLPTGKR